jgi:polar amino acid transport system substrate-binding protein/glutamate/aspartate transport system substrate-binding protein
LLVRIVPGAAVLLMGMALLSFAPAAAAADSVLDRIRAQGEIRLAYRDDAAPFSFQADGAAQPEGYSVDLCREVVKAIQTDLKLPELKTTYVKVTPENRFQAITDGKADLLCEATTATLERRETMDFSISTFISGAGMMIRPGGPNSFEQLAGQKIGVLGGTTTAQDLKSFLAAGNIAADIVTVKSHSEGFAQLESGAILVYFGDRTILQYMLAKGDKAGKLLLADQFLSIEPYALALPRDPEFRLAVDRALSRLYRTGAAKAVFAKTFGEKARPTSLQTSLYVLSGLPE